MFGACGGEQAPCASAGTIGDRSEDGRGAEHVWSDRPLAAGGKAEGWDKLDADRVAVRGRRLRVAGYVQ